MITIKRGDLFDAAEDYILQQVNCQGVMGAGVAWRFKKLYPEQFKTYKNVCDSIPDKSQLLGFSMFFELPTRRTAICVFGQEKYGNDGACYTNYDALFQAFSQINETCKGKSIAMPYRIGCGLGGGNWSIVNTIIEQCFTNCDITMYDYLGVIDE